MIQTPLSERLRFVLFGKRNVGKSSLINNIAEKPVAIVSDHPGTTTDPVSFPMELLPFGPVVFVDTAGLDDEGDLGNLRIQKTKEKLRFADIGIFVTSAYEPLSQKEQNMIEDFESMNRPLLVVLTFYQGKIHPSKFFLTHKKWVGVDNLSRSGIAEVKQKLLEMKEMIQPEPQIVDQVVKKGDFVVLVTPIDFAAPKGRLILPQVETIRELLDKDCGVMVVKETELKFFYETIGIKPSLVITDSQAFHRVAEILPPDQSLTSFSILMARKKGNLLPFIESLQKFEKSSFIKRVLILEMCNHHRQPDDIGTVKIPKLFHQHISPKAEFFWRKQILDVQELDGIDGIIMCGGCMVSRRQYEHTLAIIQDAGLPVLNYGLFFAWVNGLLPRAIEMLPDVYTHYQNLYNKQVYLRT